MTVISTFSGCGGSSLGYQRAGFDVRLALDFEERAVETYRMNFPGKTVLKANIRDMAGAKLLKEAGLEQVDILDGSPPCTPFSMAGKREDGWGTEYKHASETTSQRTDDLFSEFLRLVKEIKPKAFIAENVSGLAKGKARGYLNEILTKAAEIGYETKAHRLNASYFEVPQARVRIFIIGIRKDIFKGHPKFVPGKLQTFREAVKGLKVPLEEIARARPFPSLKPYLSRLKPWGSVQDFHPKGNFFNFKRASMERPCPTITTRMSILHPLEDRMLTVSEVKRVSTFPDDFKFLSYRDAMVRMGNSVPPNLTKNVALAVAKAINQ